MAIGDLAAGHKGPKLGQGYVRCDICGDQFLSGLVRLERGRLSEGACHKCAGTSARRHVRLGDLFPQLIPRRKTPAPSR
jgi:hypothetical protein